MEESGHSRKAEVVKYTTHLPKDIVQRIKLAAVTSGQKDYQVVHTAVVEYLARIEASK